MALALRSSTSFIKLKDIKNSKNIDDFSGMVCYAQIKPSCHLRSRKLMQVAGQISHERSSPFEMGRSDQQRENLHGLSRSHSKSESSASVFVMLPLDTVSFGGNLKKPRAMNASLMALTSAGVKVVMVDVWWGLVEKEPSKYNWEGYAELVEMVQKHGLKLQVVMSFHQCGGNVGDSCSIPLPPWVLEEISKNPDLVYTDRSGRRNPEYISLGCDSLPVLRGRTPIQVYSDYMRSFRERFKHYLGDVIEEIQVGMGPCGELRYPAYPESNGIWNFPGIGEFQCYDKYMRASLEASANAAENKDWGQSGPHDAGQYNNFPEDTELVLKDGTWNSKYRKFFLEWYSGKLIEHGDRILAAAQGIFQGTGAKLSGKIAGIHWHYRTRSHAMELIAGYSNTGHDNGYLPLARMLGNQRVVLNFTCMNIRDRVLLENAYCSPEGSVRQVKMATKTSGTQLAGQNALEKYDGGASAQVLATSRSDSGNVSSALTYLRMNKNLFEAENWQNLVEFVKSMQEGGRDTRFIRK